MNDRPMTHATCQDVQARVSGLLDGELDPEQAAVIEAHVESCDACKDAWQALQALREIFEREGRLVPPAPPWEGVAARLPRPARGAGALQRLWSIRPVVPAAAALLAAIFGGSFYLTRALLVPRHDAAPAAQTAFGEVLGLYLKQNGGSDPAVLDRYLSAHHVRAVTKDGLADNVAFRPLVPGQLPGGFRLEKIYVLATRCCNGIHLRYLRGNDVVALFQQAPGHPLEWPDEEMQEVTLAGVPCQRARVDDVEVVRVEPSGRNITLVARAGSVRLDALVSFLAAGARM